MTEIIKKACKGVNKYFHKNIRHEQFQEIHNGSKICHNVEITSITSRLCNVRTQKTVKNALCKLDTKRYYLDCNTTLGYGHPNTTKSNKQLQDSDNSKFVRVYKDNVGYLTNENVTFEYTRRIRSKGDELFDTKK